MAPEDSIIRSTDVTLGSVSQKKTDTLSKLHPWTFLICSNLGFDSSGLELISASSWYDFWENHKIRVNGAVRNLPEGVSPFYLEYEVNSFKDFSKQALISKIPVLCTYSKALEILRDLQKNKILPQNAKIQISELDLPAEIKKTILSLFQNESIAESKSEKVDSILSMVDTGQVDSKNDLSSVFQQIPDSTVTNQKITKIIGILENQVSSISDTVVNENFFSSIRDSWYQLKDFLKTAGRNENIQVYVLSKSYKESVDYLSRPDSLCTLEGTAPDFILWDYPISINTAQLSDLQETAKVADKHKSILIGSFNSEDPSVKELLNTDNITHLLQQSEYIPFTRLRKDLFTRNIVLCLTSAAPVSNDETHISGHWIFGKLWLNSFANKGTPFELTDFEITNSISLPDITEPVVKDAQKNGITIIALNTTDSNPNVLFRYEENEAYESLFYNLAVNRIAKLAVNWISKNSKKYPYDGAVTELKQFLYTQIKPYSILSSQEAVSVQKENESILVTIDSESTVSGFPFKFKFTVDFRV